MDGDYEDNKQRFALEFVKDSDKYFEFSIILADINVSNKIAKIISTLSKSIYSCKNILKRGKKRQLFKKLMKPKPTENKDPLKI